jgi:hypothetical protein
MDKEQERERKQGQLDEPFLSLYWSPASGAIMDKIYKSFQLPETLYSSYAEIIGDTILGTYRIADMPRLFQQKLNLSADDSQRLVSRLIEFLSPVVEREDQESKNKQESVRKLVGVFAKPENLSVEKTESTALPLESVVEPLRTMEGDMNRIHGYGAYQEVREKEEENPQQEPTPAKKEEDSRVDN